MLDRLNERTFGGALLLSGLGLAASPWLFGYASETAPLVTASILGVALAGLAFAAAVGRIEWTARGAMGTAAFALVAPLLFGLQPLAAALWSHWTAGLAAMLVAVAEVDFAAGRRTPSAKGGR